MKTVGNKILIIFSVVLLIGLISCVISKSNIPKGGNDRYTDFYNSYLLVNSNFEPSNCKKSMDLSTTFLSINIPENSLVSSKDDNYDGDPFQPRNRKIIFTDNEEKILYEISYLFVNDDFPTDVVTINSTSKEQIIDWTGLEFVPLNPSYEFVLMHANSIILINCTYLCEEMDTPEEINYFRESVRVFFQEFTDFLNSH